MPSELYNFEYEKIWNNLNDTGIINYSENIMNYIYLISY